MSLRRHIYEFHEIVIGGSVRAAVYALTHNLPLIYKKVSLPSYFDFLSHGIDLSCFFLENEHIKLKTKDGSKEIGLLTRELWPPIISTLSLNGNIPMADKAASIRIEDDCTLRVTTNYARFAKFKFNLLTIFDPEGVENISNKLIESPEQLYKTIDWLKITNGKKQEYDYFYVGDKLVDEIYLYPSDLCKKDSFDLKDAAVISYLTEEELRDFDYSSTYSRLKTLRILKGHGLRGKFNGMQTTDPSRVSRYDLQMELTERELIPQKRDIFEDSPVVRFNHDSLENLINQYKCSEKTITLFSSLFSERK